MKLVLIFTVLFIASQVQARPYQQRPVSSDDTKIQDSVVITKVLNVVKMHVLRVTRNRRRPLVVREGKKSHRFVIIEFLGTVTRNKNVYTAQIDADEYDHKIPRILYVDVRSYKKSFRVLRVRIGPNHFRR